RRAEPRDEPDAREGRARVARAARRPPPGVHGLGRDLGPLLGAHDREIREPVAGGRAPADAAAPLDLHRHAFWATRVVKLFGVCPTVKVNGVLVGTDKLGHFVGQGRKYYQRWLKSHDEARAAQQSAYTERAIFGSKTTGVYSNGDLVSNYEGY